MVGENGSGKSTLLRLIAGELSPDTGQLAIEPAGAICHLCPQRVDDITQAKQQWEAESARSRDTYERAHAHERALQHRLINERHKRAAAQANLSVRRRSKGIHDSDARGALAKVVARK